MDKEKQLLTDKETCAFLRVSPVTLWRMRQRKEIDFRRVGAGGKLVYTREDIENYLEGTKNKRFERGVR